MAITDWPEGERPRERLLAHGAEALSDAELLAIYLRVGVRGKSAVDLARELLLRFEGSLSALVEASLEELASVSGIGMAKAAQLKASFELARRALAREMSTRDSFSSPGKVRDWLRLKLAARQNEVFMVLWLDAQNRLIRADELFAGTLTQTSVYPREVVKAALANNAAAVILAHNHPSGVAEPSAADEMLTRNLKAALALVDVKVLDHFIVAGTGVPLSFAERGLL
jgi:DNA repair protein RadC